MKVRNIVIAVFTLLAAGCTTTTQIPPRNFNDLVNNYLAENRVYLSQNPSAICCYALDLDQLNLNPEVWGRQAVIDQYRNTVDNNYSLAWNQHVFNSRPAALLSCNASGSKTEIEKSLTIQNKGEYTALYCKTRQTPLDRIIGYEDDLQQLIEVAIDEGRKRHAIRLAEQKAKEEELRQEANRLEAERIAALENQRAETCAGFGFQRGTELFANCTFELFKLEEQSKQNRLLLEQMKLSASAVNAYQQQILNAQKEAEESRRVLEGIQQMQNAARIINPSKQTTSCKWNHLTSTMVCD